MARKLKNNNQALPPVEATILVEGTDAKIIKCTARKAFRLNNAIVRTGETFFLVKSERHPNRYYVTHFNAERNTYQCSCGCNMCEHQHLKTTREYIMSHVVAPAAVESSSEVIPMTVPATVAEIKTKRQAAKVIEEPDGSRPLTAAEWKEFHKRDKARQRAWANEYRKQAAALAG
jgi:hypothetical protein